MITGVPDEQLRFILDHACQGCVARSPTQRDGVFGGLRLATEPASALREAIAPTDVPLSRASLKTPGCDGPCLLSVIYQAMLSKADVEFTRASTRRGASRGCSRSLALG